MPLFDYVVSHAAEWPTEIKDLAYLLDSPIPSQLINDPCTVVSSRASPLLEELRNSFTESLAQFTQSDSKILDILDLVLSTVGLLRTLSNASENGAGQSTIPFWSLLIRSLAFVCYDKSFAMQEAAFVRPRLSYVRSFMEDGHASLLISHIVEDVQRPKSAVNDEASPGLLSMTAEHSKKESQEESDLEVSYDDESSSETSYERTEVSTDPTSAQSSYIPLDAHILASWHHPNSVVLPFLCVTDEDDIFSLMGGVLYQRSTWGISEPVVGIILSRTGFVARVVLGWLDKECPDSEILPAIRFAYGDETRTDASLGVYNLTDPVSAVKFSQFILGLGAHVEGIVDRCRTPTFKRLSWRSDSIDDDNSGTEEQWRQRIVNWLDAVAKCIAPSEPSSHSCSFPMTNSEQRLTRSSSKSRPPNGSMSADSEREPPPAELAADLVSDIDLVHPKKPSLDSARSKTSSDKASVQSEERGQQDSEARSDSGSSKTGKKREKSADAVSCSVLGGRSLAGISPGDRLSFFSYAHDRKIISLSNMPLPPGASEAGVDAPEEINEMLKHYENMTRYREPPIEQNEIPTVDSGVEEVRDHFLEQIKAVRRENTQKLSHQLWEVVLGRLSSLLWASVGGYSKHLAGNTPNEAEARHDWDALLNFGFMTTNELASGRIVLERAVSLSRNIAADVMKTTPNSNGAEFKTVANQMDTIATQYVAYTNNSTAKLRLQSRTLSLVTGQNLEDVDDLFSTPKKAKKAIFRRSGDEPELGIVDAILTVPLEPMKPIPEPLIRAAVSRATLQASTRALSADNIAEPEEELPISEERNRTSGFSNSGSKHARSLKGRSQLGSIAEDQPGFGQASRQRTGQKVDRKSLQPFAVTCSETKSALPMTWPRGVMNIKVLLTKILLAVLFAEYKKPTQTYAKALIQAKMYLEASVRYLASLGVTKLAVFALVTDGVEGAILMAWCSSDLETIYIVERNVRTFNISSPIEVYHFVTVLVRLREYGDTTLKTAVESALKAEDFKQTTWTKTAQFDRMESDA
ncbi:hypothetical protein EDD18DRAFT_3220 [Armillaria luteobubalina]|uniref:Uncharacterized protein n=1 Tax=Armillaria luteobubalina TaxID=153913 RepID=A0AA39QQ52_9AGAR|nr:hypothetical protein EDD18DRAFT_3220 [Armillaria luteobubalina]